MEAVLLAAGGAVRDWMWSPSWGKCASLYRLRKYKWSARGRRSIRRCFRTITIKYLLKGNLDPEKVKHAIELSLNKYCSVTNGLAPKARITYAFEISGGNE